MLRVAYTTGGTIGAAGGSIALTADTGGTLNVDNAITAGAGGARCSNRRGPSPWISGGSVTNSGAVSTAGYGRP